MDEQQQEKSIVCRNISEKERKRKKQLLPGKNTFMLLSFPGAAVDLEGWLEALILWFLKADWYNNDVHLSM